MEFNDDERKYLDWARMLSTDNTGEEIFVGLTVNESREYYIFTRPTYRSNGDKDALDRYLVLHQKMEAARFEVMGAEVTARDDNSPRH